MTGFLVASEKLKSDVQMRGSTPSTGWSRSPSAWPGRFHRLRQDRHPYPCRAPGGIGTPDAPLRRRIRFEETHGADIAKESCDILLTEGRLSDLILLRELSSMAMDRVSETYRGIIGVNTALVFLSISGLLTPRLSALLHNTYTLAAGLLSFRPYQLLPQEEEFSQ